MRVQGLHINLCHSSSVTSDSLWQGPPFLLQAYPPGLALLVSLHPDPAPGPAIPSLTTSLLLSHPISPTDLNSLQPSEQPGVKSKIQEWKLTLCPQWLWILTPLDGEPVRKSSSVRTACQTYSKLGKASILQLTKILKILLISKKYYSSSHDLKCIYSLTSPRLIWQYPLVGPALIYN